MPFSVADGGRIIELLNLQPIPVEGGLFTRTWIHMANDAVPGDPPVGTAIYGAFTDDADSFSALHRLREVEIWHHYTGDPIHMLLLGPDGAVEEPILGPNILGGQRPQVVVPAGTWMGASVRPGGTFSLFGTTMAPGFTAESFETGDRNDLIATWPQATERITALTRLGAPLRMPDDH